MTTDRQLKAVAYAIHEAAGFYGTETYSECLKWAKAAIEAMQVREMTENELANTIAEEIYANEDRELAFSTINLCQRIAGKLAKLGAIRIVEK